MKISVILPIALAASATAVAAENVAPTAVSYVDGAVEQSLTGVPGDPVRGRELVGSKGEGNCVACHAVTDLSEVPFHGEIGPMLDGAGDRWNDAQLRGILVNPKMVFDGTIMPAFYKTDGFTRPGNAYTGDAADDTFGPLLAAQDIEDVVAYLATLKD